MIQLWDAETGQVRLQVNTLSTTPNNAQVMSSDNNLILAGDSEGAARLADAHTGQVIRQFVGHTGPIWDVAFSLDHNYILTGGDDKTARLWDTKTGQELHQLTGHTAPVRAVAFSTDGRYLLTGSEDDTARLWDAQTGQEVRSFVGHTGAILAVAFSSDGRYLLTGSEDNTARLWDTQTGQEVRSFIGHTAQVRRVAFSPDGRYALSGSSDHTARLWDVGSGQVMRQFAGHTSPLQFVAFSADGRHILTGDDRMAFLWRTRLEDAIAFACTHLSRDLNSAERVLYHINDTAPTCAELVEQKIEIEPTWTPVPPRTVKEAPLVFSVEMEFLNESVNIQMGIPIQDVFVDAGNGQVVRPEVLNEETLALPVYRSAVEVFQDGFEPPWDAGPYPKGEPLGLTLGDYVAVTGRGTYTAQGDRAKVELTFDQMAPQGLYTLWCNSLSFARATVTESPCLAPDGSVYGFTADAKGHGELNMDIKAFPPSTQEAIYEIAVAYHSDGQTHGYSMGEHGRNSHGLLFYDFMPPENAQDAAANASLVATDSSAVAREWMHLLVERVQADFLSAPVAARIYAYGAITLYEAVVPGTPNLKSLQRQLNGLSGLPQPGEGPYNWPAVAASAEVTVAKALFESPNSQAAFDKLYEGQRAALQGSGLAADLLDRSIAYGQRLGQALVAWMEKDGYQELRKKPYTPPTGPGYWVPTTPSRPKPTTPYWGDLRPLALTPADACKPPDPIPYSEQPGSAFYAQAREVYDTSQTLNAEQKATAFFWADAMGMTGTPAGHWVSIVNQLSAEQKLSLDKTVELHALVGIGLADAFISCWKEKYIRSLIRPESYIQQHIDPDWQPLFLTPPFPEYPSGHSTASATAAEILTALLGPMPFTDATHENRGLGVRHFTSFTEATQESALSRLYGGIHYRMGIENGLTQGQCIGRTILKRIQTR